MFDVSSTYKPILRLVKNYIIACQATMCRKKYWFINFLWCILCNIQVFLQVQCTFLYKNLERMILKVPLLARLKVKVSYLEYKVKIYNISPLHLAKYDVFEQLPRCM